MKDNKQIWIVIGITVIVALVVSLGVASITGNVIKVRSSLIGTQVYTKAEVDTLMAGKIDGVCTPAYSLSNANTNCNSLCGEKKCVVALKTKVQVLSSGEDRQDLIIPCTDNITTGNYGEFRYTLSCVCCS
ncbi:MAG: hypothetical protein WC533_03035 [Candidatus Pacearchaeota archaeon]